MENKNSGSSLSKALNMLNHVCTSPVPLRFAELVELSELPKATAHRQLNTLLEHGLVRFDEHKQAYYPGYGLLALAHRTWANLDIRDVAAAPMRDLWSSTQETIHLAVLDGADVIYIDKLESPKSLRLYSAVGKKGPVYCTGVGKAMLAFLPDDKQKDIIDHQAFFRHTEHTLTTPEALKVNLAQIREKGISLDLEEHEMGIKCAAAPIFNSRHEAVAAISVTAPAFRTSDDVYEAMKNQVKDAANAISKRLGACD
ncbi:MULTISPECIES: IclR family transcriptional regulator [Marinomonas]|uniref:IclR family transcriptional regulator n=1 Tax=Marinomonas arctica TaxID=383750 RepID=A0A7H1J7U0_9GAMM|nr:MULTISPECIES: IclR family transcriptional regulator [Marinomonas]MCS7487535.1 IclR family transcriptional regulator [Marinomonas sp. BSi20414]QNT06556.1 IclR family transcriptional regulator [Marinomonas arctica]GGN35900.1 IclR family transcriptional regulator [Marinomonas arctica]